MKLLLWPGMLLVLTNIMLLAKKRRSGFAAGIAANVLFAVFNVHVALWPYLVCNIVFIAANVHGWRSWRGGHVGDQVIRSQGDFIDKKTAKLLEQTYEREIAKLFEQAYRKLKDHNPMEPQQ
jgi:hypothetical protein